MISALCFSPRNKNVATSSTDGSVLIWDATTGDICATFLGHEASVNTISFSSDGKWVATGSTDGTIRIWDVVKKRIRWTLRHKADGIDQIKEVDFFDNVMKLSSTSITGTVVVWHLDPDPMPETVKPNVHRPTISPNGRFISWMGTMGGVLYMTDRTLKDQQPKYFPAASSRPLQKALEPYETWNRVMFSRDDQLMAKIRNDGLILVSTTSEFYNSWSIDMCLQKIPEANKDIYLLSSSRRSEAVFCDYESLEPRSMGPDIVQVSSNKEKLICVSKKSIYLWHIRTEELENTLVHPELIKNICISPNDQYIAFTSIDRTIRIWELKTGTLRREMVISGTETMVFFGNGTFSPPPGTSVEEDFEENSSCHEPLFVTNPWITFRSEKLIWLPVEYRGTCVTAHK